MKTFISALVLSVFVFCSCSNYKNIQEPEFRDINNVRVIKVGVLQTTAGVDLVYYNPNDFGVQLSNAKGDVYIDNAYFGRFDLDNKVQVKKHSEFVLPIVFKLDNTGAIKNQKDIYKKKEALVRIEGMVRVKKSGFSKEIPIKFEGTQNIERFRTLVSR